MALAERGAFDEGIAHGQEGIRIAEAVDHPYSLASVCLNLAYLYRIKGDYARAVDLLGRALALSRDWNLTALSLLATASQGHAYALSGRAVDGLPLLEDALPAIQQAGMRAYHSLGLVHLGEAYLLAGRLEDARASAERALAWTRERGQRFYEAWAVRLLGELAFRSHPPDTRAAEEHYLQALARARELGMSPLIAHCHLGLGKLYRRVGDRLKAAEHLNTAVTLYREMDMGSGLAQAEAELMESA